MINFNNKYTILVIVLVAIALLFAIWGIYKKIKPRTNEESSYKLNQHEKEQSLLYQAGRRKRKRHTKNNKK